MNYKNAFRVLLVLVGLYGAWTTPGWFLYNWTHPTATPAPKVDMPTPTAPVAPVAPAVNEACYGATDGSVVPYGGKVEFAASAVNTVKGPAVVEWWDGVGGQGHEGMYYIPEGKTLTLPRNVRGGYWSIVASSAMTAEKGLTQLMASHAHLVAFSQKPQHSYATAALQAAFATCDWTELETMMVYLPKGATIK